MVSGGVASGGVALCANAPAMGSSAAAAPAINSFYAFIITFPLLLTSFNSSETSERQRFPRWAILDKVARALKYVPSGARMLQRVACAAVGLTTGIVRHHGAAHLATACAPVRGECARTVPQLCIGR